MVNLQLSSGLADLNKSESEIEAKLKSDTSIDGVFSLNADIATGSAMPASKAVGRDIVNGTVDLSDDAVQAIKDGKLAFAIDQQQYGQGYLSVALLYLNKIDGHGPRRWQADVHRSRLRDQGQRRPGPEAGQGGHPLIQRRRPWRGGAHHHPATGGLPPLPPRPRSTQGGPHGCHMLPLPMTSAWSPRRD